MICVFFEPAVFLARKQVKPVSFALDVLFFLHCLGCCLHLILGEVEVPVSLVTSIHNY